MSSDKNDHISASQMHNLYPEATVGALIFNAENRLFLMRSDKWNGRYCLPGGHIELGERIIDAVKREVKEETNLDITDIHFHSVQDCIFSPDFHEKKHFIFIDFICRSLPGEVILNEEGTEYIWIDITTAHTYPLEPFTLKTIELLHSKEKSSPYIEHELS